MNNYSPDADYTENLKQRILGFGADLVGIADVEPLREMTVYPSDLLDSFTRVISIAVRIPVEVFRQITGRPTPTYYSMYKTANLLLDQIALLTANAIYKDGYSSLPIPAAQRWDVENAWPAISHKAVGNVAGLGWQGKGLLLVNPVYGPRIRLVSVLTDAPLVADRPIENRCGSCRLCIDACPAKAIKGTGTDFHYRTREEAFDMKRCEEQLAEFTKLPNIESNICGICIAVCPFGS
ncbi:MAG: epoxyqueuosine reductase [Dehalococcoidales bacterium]|nr:epoxyqueuosine reductase [Dehalococcoidales bacterium]